MSLVLVHGVPETAAIWGPLRAELGRDDVVTLSPPGFGAPVPAGFDATSDGYLGWLIGEVEATGGPVDLLGHDWGGLHVLRLVAARPDLVRSWSIDVAGAVDPGYVWHDLARRWQRPGEGEATIEAMSAVPEDARAARFVGLGMSPEVARAVAQAGGPEMGRCILSLYRSGVQPRPAGWGREVENVDRPMLVINPTADVFIGTELTHRSAQRFGAQEAVLDGLGHWWMLEDPARGAAVIAAFLDTLP